MSSLEYTVRRIQRAPHMFTGSALPEAYASFITKAGLNVLGGSEKLVNKKVIMR